MRVDKFLKVSRIIKRRTLAKEAIEHNLVLINDKLAKPGTTVKVGDTITLNLPFHTTKILVLELSPSDPKLMFEQIS